MKKLLKDYWFVLLYLSIFFIIINLVVINRFQQFEAYYFDHGLYDGSIWKVAHFQTPLISHHFTKTPLLQLGDHFTPAIYLLSPMYWLTKSYIPILVVHNFFLILSAFVLLLIAKILVKSRLMVFAIIFVFTGFVGMQNAIIANFHTEIPALFPLSLMFYFLLQKRWRWFYFFLVLSLLFKESISVLTFSVGIYLILTKEFKKGIIISMFSITYYFVVTKFIMPALSGYSYFYNPASFIFNPINIISKFFLPQLKLQTLFVSFASFSFLPLLNPLFLPVILQDYFVRFVIDGAPSRIDLGLHYNAIPSLLLAISSMITIHKLGKYQPYRKLIKIHAIVIIFIFLLFQYKLHGPLALAFNPAFYAHTKNLDFLRNFIKKIPNDKGLTMTQNNLAAQMTHSHDLMLLRENYWDYNPKIIAIDVRAGQSANNFWPLPPKQFEELYVNLKKDNNYRIVNVTNDQLIFIRK